MNIGIIDADLIDGGTRFPNLAAMKIAGFWQQKGGNVRLCLNFADACECEKIFVSKVFTKTKLPDWLSLLADRCEFGGTGFCLQNAAPLPDEIEHSKPLYDLYKPFVETFRSPPSWLDSYTKSSIGFTSRGCFRRCPFCVNKNKKRSERWSRVKEFLDDARPTIELLDDNIFACKDWQEIFDELNETGKRFVFKQGLDIRLMSEMKSRALQEARYKGEIIFAFDNASEEKEFRRGAERFRTHCNKAAKAYVLTGFYKSGVDEIRDVFKRLAILSEYRILPYLMRHEKYKSDLLSGVYVELARWINQPGFYKKMSFQQFVEKGASKKNKQVCEDVGSILRKEFSANYWE